MSLFFYNGEQIIITAILDTGADVTIVLNRKWPSHWPLQKGKSGVCGIGGMSLAMVTNNPVTIMTENKSAQALVTVLPLPEGTHALIGREVLTQWGVLLTTPDTVFWQRPL